MHIVDLQISSNWNVNRLLRVPGVHGHQLLTDIRFTEQYEDNATAGGWEVLISSV